ncbi:MAG TPA: SRPBCC family protein, partial [Marmoricola sp.]|nr:SRPBCC family protein [Marmoricola sp.]
MDSYELQDQIDITASPAQVWALVHDVTRMPDWSPQVTSVRLRSGFDTIGLGTQFTNRNHQGDLEWTTHGEIVRFRVDEEIAFRIEENWVIWSFSLAPGEGGTRLTQRRQAPEGISPLS